MTQPPTTHLLRWIAACKMWAVWLRGLSGSLKLRLALACLLLIAASIGVTTSVLLDRAAQRTERAVLDLEQSNAERLAGVLGNRIVTLQQALRASTLNTHADTFTGRAHAVAFLNGKPVLATLFSTTFVAAPDGRVLATRDEQGVQASDFNLADRPYFQQTLRQRRPVVSEPLVGRLSREPVIMLTMPILGPGDGVLGVVGGSLRLSSRELMTDLTQDSLMHQDPVQTIVTDGLGRIIAHRQHDYILRDAGALPGMAAAMQQWGAQGRPIEPNGVSLHADGYIVTRAGVAGLDWMVFRVAADDALLGGLRQARPQAWGWAALVALAGSAVMLLLILLLLRPLAQLEQRARALLQGEMSDHEGWPEPGGEIGQLSRVLQHVLRERAQTEQYNAGLLRQMHSMLAAAPIGIAFSRQRRFELVSAEFARLLSQTPEDLCGQLTKQIFASDADYDELGQRVAQAFAQHGRFDDELRFIRRDGSVFWGRIQGQPVDPANEHGGTIWLLADITRERSEREQLSWSASHDALTGVHNRRALEAHLGSALAQRSRAVPLALLFIDLDRFKQVNDSAGHAAGDQMLCAVAQVLLARVRGSDMVARIGGDEFAVLLQGCEYQAALAVAEQIRLGVEAIDLAVDAVHLGVGASVGVAELDETVSDVAVACALADAACYKIKRDGRSSAGGRGVMPPRLVVIDS